MQLAKYNIVKMSCGLYFFHFGILFSIIISNFARKYIYL